MSSRIFVLTGAGVSAESGLGTFRDKHGVWARHDLREVATPEGFARDPAKVHAFYNARRRKLQDARPNAAHVALAELARSLDRGGGWLYLCTQNVDDLHERAGAPRVAHMHGELLRARCGGCGSSRAWREDIEATTVCPSCDSTGRMRPDVVWFGEMPMRMDEIQASLAACDLFVAIGTSGAVYPAANFVDDARRAGVRTCEINLEPSQNADLFDEGVYGPATDAVPAWAAVASTGVSAG
jgi:NAD-dependent deacetylase